MKPGSAQYRAQREQPQQQRCAGKSEAGLRRLVQQFGKWIFPGNHNITARTSGCARLRSTRAVRRCLRRKNGDQKNNATSKTNRWILHRMMTSSLKYGDKVTQCNIHTRRKKQRNTLYLLNSQKPASHTPAPYRFIFRHTHCCSAKIRAETLKSARSARRRNARPCGCQSPRCRPVRPFRSGGCAPAPPACCRAG